MKFINWLLSLFGVKSDEQKLLGSSDKEENLLEVVEKKDRSPEIISGSQDHIKKIYDIAKLSEKTSYHPKFLKVLELTQQIHDKIISEEKVPNTRLEQFHMYYTDEFINTYTEALNDLLPKKEIDKTLLSSYKLQQEIDEEKKKRDEEELINNVFSLGTKERIELLLTSINKDWKLVQEKEYHDTIEKERMRGVNTTYADKYTTYLINNWKLSKNVKFIGELNKSECPIVYDINTLEVFKVIYDSVHPEKLGDIKDDTMKNILQKKFRGNNVPSLPKTRY